MRAAIDVIPLKSKTVTVEATWNKFTGKFLILSMCITANFPFIAQTCTFPFIFNLVNYTACTTANDTRPWCSPTSTYAGQRLYCTPAGKNTCLQYFYNLFNDASENTENFLVFMFSSNTKSIVFIDCH